MKLDKRLLLRFWSKVRIRTNPDRCWLWLPPLDEKGRGQFYCQGKPVKAHKMSFAIANGEFPKLNCLHSCDNPSCVNPRHLSDDTQAENIRQMHERGRARKCRGAVHPKSKLSDEQVAEIRTSTETGYSLSKRLGVSPTAVYSIRKNKNRRETQCV
jgi:hypothetical protein